MNVHKFLTGHTSLSLLPWGHGNSGRWMTVGDDVTWPKAVS